MRIIAIAGLPGSGKSVVAEEAARCGLPVVTMGDVVRRIAEERGVTHGEAAVEVRLSEGRRAIAREVARQLGGDVVVVEGLRGVEELEELSKLGEVVLIYVAAPRRARYARLVARARPGDHLGETDLVFRDLRELKFGVANLLAYADHILVNDSTLEEFRARVRTLLKSLGLCEG